MSKIKTISTHDGSAWGTEIPLGADAINVDITSATTNPSDSSTTVASLGNSDITVAAGDTAATAWTKFNKTRNRIVSVLDNFNVSTSITFDITLSSEGWSNNTQTISNSNFVTSGYWYSVAPAPADFIEYSTCGVRAADVTTSGSITFYCEDVPSSNLTVHIVRTSAEV